VDLALDLRTALPRCTQALAPKRGRSADRIAEETVVEAGADRIEEGRVEDLMAEERPIRADRRPAPVACDAAVEPRRPPLRARAVRALLGWGIELVV
jgi:hypothetical protein